MITCTVTLHASKVRFIALGKITETEKDYTEAVIPKVKSLIDKT